MGIDELAAAGGDVRARRDDAGRHRGIHREDLVFLGLLDEQLLHLLHLVGILVGDVLGLAEVLGQIVKFQHLVVERVRVGRTERLPRRAVDLGAEQPAVIV